MVSRRDQAIDARILKEHDELVATGLDHGAVLERLSAQFPDYANRVRDLIAPIPSTIVAPWEHLPPKYEVRDNGQRGGQGTVFRAYDKKDRREVAIKICSSLAWDTAGRGRFEAEADHLKRLRDIDGVCDIYDTGEVGGYLYIVMEFIDGSPIQSPGGRKADRRRTLARFERVARTLHRIHGLGLCHRDIKPSNILVSSGGYPTLVDFGLTVGDETSRFTRTGDVVGSIPYTPPERLEARVGKPTSPQEDIYSLGVSMYEVLAGRLPFSGPTLALLMRQISDGTPRPLGLGGDLDTVVSVAMSLRPTDRYSTARDLAEDLKRLRTKQPIAARSPRWSRRALAAARRRPVSASLISMSTLLLAFITYAYFLVDGERAKAETNRAIAIDLLERVSFGLYEEIRDEPGGGAMLASLLALVEGSFDALGTVDADDLQLRSFDVLRHQLRSEVARVQGRFQDSLREGNNALRKSSTIAQQFPASQKALRDWLVVLLHLTEVLSDAGNPVEAQGHLDTARDRYEVASKGLIDETTRTKDRITIDFVATRIAEQLSNFETARRCYKRAVESLGTLAVEDAGDRDAARLKAIVWTDYLGFLTEQRDPLANPTCEIALEAAHHYRKSDTLHARIVLLKCQEVAADIKIRANHSDAIRELEEIHEEIHGLGGIAPNDAQIERQHIRLTLRLAQHHERAGAAAKSLSFADELSSLTKRATDRDPLDSVAWRIAADADSLRYRLSSSNPELLVQCGRSMAGAIEGRTPALDDVEDLQAAAKLWGEANANSSPHGFMDRIGRARGIPKNRRARLLVDSAVITGLMLASSGERPKIEEELRATSKQWLDLLANEHTGLSLWIALYGLRILDLTWATAEGASESFAQHVRNRLDSAWGTLVSRANARATTVVSVEILDLLAKVEERIGDLDGSLKLRLMSSRGSNELARNRPDRWELLRDQLVNLYFAGDLFRRLGDKKNEQASKLSAKRVLITFDKRFPRQENADIDAVRRWARDEG